MTEISNEIVEAIRLAVKETVNGKIDKLQHMMKEHADEHKINDAIVQTHMKADEEYQKQDILHRQEDLAFRKKLEPVIVAWEDYNAFGKISQKVFSGAVKFLLGVTVIIGSVIGLREWFKK